MRVVIAPDSFKGTLSAREAAEAIAAGWREARPDDRLVIRPMSDGGDGYLAALATALDDLESLEVEVADPLGHPRAARVLIRGETAYVESAQACGLDLLGPTERDPLRTTTYGVGQLLDAARETGCRRVLVGLGGSATVDGGAGALTALGFRLRVADGSGLKIGGGELAKIDRIERGWVAPSWSEIDVQVLADVRTTLLDAPRRFGPQKGADPDAVARLEAGLLRWADVVERDLDVSFRDVPGGGAAGGLGFGLTAGLQASIVPGGERVADLVRLPVALADADLLIVGEGELDQTSVDGKVVGTLLDLAASHGVRVAAVVGRATDVPPILHDVVEAAPAADAYDGVLAAARSLAASIADPGRREQHRYTRR